MPKTLDITGQKYNRLTAIEYAGTSSNQKRQWRCLCECGKYTLATTTELKRGDIKSCGCYYREWVKIGRLSHGLCYTDEYGVWSSMKRRCFNPKEKEYPSYGGRGIKVCERWMSFKNFYDDMGPRPTKDHSIDRYPDNDGNYEPGNCRWATDPQQHRNTSRNIFFEFRGKTFIMLDLAILTGVPYETIKYYRKRMSIEEIIDMHYEKKGMKVPEFNLAAT